MFGGGGKHLRISEHACFSEERREEKNCKKESANGKEREDEARGVLALIAARFELLSSGVDCRAIYESSQELLWSQLLHFLNFVFIVETLLLNVFF